MSKTDVGARRSNHLIPCALFQRLIPDTGVSERLEFIGIIIQLAVVVDRVRVDCNQRSFRQVSSIRERVVLHDLAPHCH